jgi:hypothetical protein
MTEAYENRIANGLLKADIGILSPEDVQARLSKDVLVVCPPERSSRRDLWPCIWFLASVLHRQFTGRVLLDVGLRDEFPAPIPLGSRCRFVATSDGFDGITIGLGTNHRAGAICGDARGNSISYQELIGGHALADPVSCAALAGYLGFSALEPVLTFGEQW